MYPEDPRSPFYNPKSQKMTPLAKLYLRREKIISRNCDDDFLQALQLEVSDDAEEHDTRGMTQFTYLSFPLLISIFPNISGVPRQRLQRVEPLLCLMWQGHSHAQSSVLARRTGTASQVHTPTGVQGNVRRCVG